MHLRFAALLTAWTNAGWRKASKLLRSVIWCREFILRVGAKGYILNEECIFCDFYTLLPAISVHWSQIEMNENDKMSHNDRAMPMRQDRMFR